MGQGSGAIDELTGEPGTVLRALLQMSPAAERGPPRVKRHHQASKLWNETQPTLFPRPASPTVHPACLPGGELPRAGLGADLEQKWGFWMIPQGRGMGVVLRRGAGSEAEESTRQTLFPYCDAGGILLARAPA